MSGNMRVGIVRANTKVKTNNLSIADYQISQDTSDGYLVMKKGVVEVVGFGTDQDDSLTTPGGAGSGSGSGSGSGGAGSGSGTYVDPDASVLTVEEAVKLSTAIDASTTASLTMSGLLEEASTASGVLGRLHPDVLPMAISLGKLPSDPADKEVLKSAVTKVAAGDSVYSLWNGILQQHNGPNFTGKSKMASASNVVHDAMPIVTSGTTIKVHMEQAMHTFTIEGALRAETMSELHTILGQLYTADGVSKDLSEVKKTFGSSVFLDRGSLQGQDWFTAQYGGFDAAPADATTPTGWSHFGFEAGTRPLTLVGSPFAAYTLFFFVCAPHRVSSKHYGWIAVFNPNAVKADHYDLVKGTQGEFGMHSGSLTNSAQGGNEHWSLDKLPYVYKRFDGNLIQDLENPLGNTPTRASYAGCAMDSDLIYVPGYSADYSGVIVAYDKNTGAHKWTFDFQAAHASVGKSAFAGDLAENNITVDWQQGYTRCVPCIVGDSLVVLGGKDGYGSATNVPEADKKWPNYMQYMNPAIILYSINKHTGALEAIRQYGNSEFLEQDAQGNDICWTTWQNFTTQSPKAVTMPDGKKLLICGASSNNSWAIYRDPNYTDVAADGTVSKSVMQHDYRAAMSPFQLSLNPGGGFRMSTPGVYYALDVTDINSASYGDVVWKTASCPPQLKAGNPVPADAMLASGFLLIQSLMPFGETAIPAKARPADAGGSDFRQGCEFTVREGDVVSGGVLNLLHKDEAGDFPSYTVTDADGNESTVTIPATLLANLTEIALPDFLTDTGATTVWQLGATALSADDAAYLAGVQASKVVVDLTAYFANTSNTTVPAYMQRTASTTRHVFVIKKYVTGDLIENEDDAYHMNFYGASAWGATPAITDLANGDKLAVIPTGQQHFVPYGHNLMLNTLGSFRTLSTELAQINKDIVEAHTDADGVFDASAITQAEVDLWWAKYDELDASYAYDSTAHANGTSVRYDRNFKCAITAVSCTTGDVKWSFSPVTWDMWFLGKSTRESIFGNAFGPDVDVGAGAAILELDSSKFAVIAVNKGGQLLHAEISRADGAVLNLTGVADSSPDILKVLNVRVGNTSTLGGSNYGATASKNLKYTFHAIHNNMAVGQYPWMPADVGFFPRRSLADADFQYVPANKGFIVAWDVVNKRTAWTSVGGAGIGVMNIDCVDNADGSCVVIQQHWDGAVSFWDGATGAEISRMPEGSVNAPCTSSGAIVGRDFGTFANAGTFFSAGGQQGASIMSIPHFVDVIDYAFVVKAPAGASAIQALGYTVDTCVNDGGHGLYAPGQADQDDYRFKSQTLIVREGELVVFNFAAAGHNVVPITAGCTCNSTAADDDARALLGASSAAPYSVASSLNDVGSSFLWKAEIVDGINIVHLICAPHESLDHYAATYVNKHPITSAPSMAMSIVILPKNF